MKKWFRMILICSVIVSMAFGAGATETASSQSKDPIRIGIPVRKSGALGLMGENRCRQV